MQGCKKGDKVYFTIGANQEEGVVESIERASNGDSPPSPDREDGTSPTSLFWLAMATIRYETKKTGETKHFNRNVEKIEPAT